MRPKVRDSVTALCVSCNCECSVVFRDLINSVNKHVLIGLSGYHCKACLHKSDVFKKMHRKNSKKSLDKIKLGASDRSKKLWQQDDYKSKMATNHANLSSDKDFALKVSKSISKKFEDPEYCSKVKEARKHYWDNSDYRYAHAWDKSEFVKAAVREHGLKYSYEFSDYKNVKAKIKIICPKHGLFTQRPSHHVFYGNGCPQCAFEIKTSKPQMEIYDWIRSLGFHVILNDRKELGGLELDLYIPSVKLAIEYHGGFWHSYNKVESAYERKRHYNKASVAVSKGIRLLQIFDVEWQNQTELVKSMVRHRLGLSKPIYARKCKVVNISLDDYHSFCDINHLAKRKPCDLCFGLYYDGKIVSVISFSEIKDSLYEVERYCSLSGYLIVGGLSKLLKAASLPKLMTYADRRYSDASGYLATGFVLTSITKPGYYYWRNNKIFNRRSFQKHKLSSKLAVFDPKLTEAENMFNNGYRRIWDAGHYKLIK